MSKRRRNEISYIPITNNTNSGIESTDVNIQEAINHFRNNGQFTEQYVNFCLENKHKILAVLDKNDPLYKELENTNDYNFVFLFGKNLLVFEVYRDNNHILTITLNNDNIEFEDIKNEIENDNLINIVKQFYSYSYDRSNEEETFCNIFYIDPGTNILGCSVGNDGQQINMKFVLTRFNHVKIAKCFEKMKMKILRFNTIDNSLNSHHNYVTHHINSLKLQNPYFISTYETLEHIDKLWLEQLNRE